LCAPATLISLLHGQTVVIGTFTANVMSTWLSPEIVASTPQA